MKIRYILLALVAVVAMQSQGKGKNVLMTVGNTDISVSEFEYLYQKSVKQQVTPESLSDYLQRYILYKRKVLDAEAAGIDTTQAFIKELGGYKADLMKPYMADDELVDKMAREQYAHMQEGVEMSMIALPVGKTDEEKTKNRNLIDSIYGALQGGASFEELAKQHSAERNSAAKGGLVGYMTAGKIPLPIETALYTLPEGQFSQVIPTPGAYYIIKPGKRRASMGQVHVAHILKLFPKNATAEQKKQTMDFMLGIHDRLLKGEDFAKLAKENSEDGSAREGGMLPWFGAGQMVPEFEEVSFALKDGDISMPFETRYGVHVVKKYESKGIGSFEDNEKAIKEMMNRDGRMDSARASKLAQVKQQLKYVQVADLGEVVNRLEDEASGDAATVQQSLSTCDEVAFKIGKESVKVCDLFEKVDAGARNSTSKQYATRIVSAMKAKESEMLFDRYLTNNEDYQNLYNEYRDGLMLFEMSTRRVWGVASNDKKQLEDYFLANRDKYKWDTPRFKGYLLIATNDSVNALAKKMIEETGMDNMESLASKVRKTLKDNARIEKVLAKKGENAILDELAFGGKPADKSKIKFKIASIVKGGVIDQPQESLDVNTQVVSDFQDKLEEAWIKELEAKYPAKVNEKMLKKVKEVK